ncbi:MAG: hypothetical protein ACRDJW_26195 [Thermomicrobiales bacterium]
MYALAPRMLGGRRLLGIALSALGLLAALLAIVLGVVHGQATPVAPPSDLALVDAAVRHHAELDLVVFDLQVAGTAGGTLPTPAGALDGAPVLAYAFPTTLAPGAVGFSGAEGTVALVVTAHPDFDDTPLWDENGDGDPTNDGATYHSHWVLLVADERTPGGLSVAAVADADPAAVLPPTNAGLPIYLDSPGFAVRLTDETVRVVLPGERLGGETTFTFDAVTASLVVNTSDEARPLLGVTEVYSVLSGDLSLPYTVEAE